MAKKWSEIGRTTRGKATKRIHLAKKAIERIPVPETGRTHVYDASTAGLGVRVEANGQSFFWFRKVNGRPTFRSIGAVTDVSIEKARETAQEWNGALAEWKRHKYEGESPFEQSHGELTLGELLDRYIERRVKPKATQPEKAEAEVRWMFQKYLSHWRGYKLGQIQRKYVRELHEKLGHDNGKITADRCVQLIRRLYFWAASEKVELWKGENPATKIEFNGDNPRDRFLQPGELVRLDEALKIEPNEDLKDFVELALATGARRSNVLGMEWEQINDETGTWTIPRLKTKNKKPYVVVLTGRAVTVLKRRSHLRSSTPWVFPSAGSKSGHVVAMRKPFQKLLMRANITDFTIHDLRRTNASYQAISGQSLQAIAATLGHSSVTSTQIYAKLNSDAARASLEAGVQMQQKVMAAARKKQKLLKAARA